MLTKNLKVFGYKVPTYPLFMMSGAICDVFQALIDYMISIVYTIDWAKATVCWTLSYTLSIIIRHYSHRMIVFGEYEGTYCSSLGRTYLAYSSSIVISMFMNHYLVEGFGLEHKVAYLITMLGTGIYNYFALKASWRSNKGSTSSATTTSRDPVSPGSPLSPREEKENLISDKV